MGWGSVREEVDRTILQAYSSAMKLHFVRELKDPIPPFGAVPGEWDELPTLTGEAAEVFLDGYRDTIDYEGETLDDTGVISRPLRTASMAP